jgi:nucleoid-associated protein YgaU
MPTHPGKIALALALLVAVWIGVYWWWDPKPPITFAPTTASSAEPEPPVEVEPAPREPLVVPEEPEAKSKPVADGPRVAVIPPEYVEYTIQPGDTLASLSRKFFGSSSKAEAIARMNPTMSPPNMKPGRVIKIPKDPNNIQGKPAPEAAEPRPPNAGEGSTGSVEHKVLRGDTLSGISKRYYGSSHPRYIERLLDANKGVISAPEDLRPGQVLKIPPK